MAKITIRSNSGEKIAEIPANAYMLRSNPHAFISAGALLRSIIAAIDEALDKDVQDEPQATEK